MKRVITFILCCLIIFAAYLAHAVVPKSVQVYLAAIAECEISDLQLRELDGQFLEATWWERPLAKAYRLKYWYGIGESVISEELAGNLSVLHLSLTAAQDTSGICDKSTLALFSRSVNQGAPVDYYDSLGYTALQQAIIFRKPEFVQVLLENGANPALKVKRQDSSLLGLNSVEIAEHLHRHNRDGELEKIIKLLSKEYK